MNKKTVHLVVLLVVYLLGYFLCRLYFAQGMPFESYTAGWIYRRSFMYTWVAVIILIFANKPMTATLTTVGCFFGIVIGDVLGGWIITVRIAQLEELINSGVAVGSYEKAQAYHHYGILPIWFVVIILFVMMGLILDKRNRLQNKGV